MNSKCQNSRIAPRRFTDSFRITAGLLIIAGCIRLIISDLNLGSYGNFRIPLLLQLVGPYILLIIAVARAQSERVARWLLLYVAAQVLFTFSMCYKVQHMLASVLENQIPHIALAQLAAALLILVSAQWCDRGVVTTKQIFIGLSIALNISILLMFEVTRSRLADAQQELLSREQGPAMREAERDFKFGRLRQYEVVTIPEDSPEASEPKKAFTGRTNGHFEIWSFSRYAATDDEGFWRRRATSYVDSYNRRMAVLDERQSKRVTH